MGCCVFCTTTDSPVCRRETTKKSHVTFYMWTVDKIREIFIFFVYSYNIHRLYGGRQRKKLINAIKIWNGKIKLNYLFNVDNIFKLIS